MDSSVSSRPQAPTVAPWLGAHQFDQARAVLRGVAGGDQRLDRRRHARGDRRGGQAEIGRPHDLALADRDAAQDLREIFAEPDADEQFLDLGKPPAAMHALGIGGELPHRLDIGRKPGEPVGGALLAVEQARDRPPLQHHALAHLGGGVGQQRPRPRWVAACAMVTRSCPGASEGAACGIGDFPS